mgnify:CR=1 FL=1
MIKKKSYWILMLTAICILAVTGCKKEGKTADFHIYYTDSEGVSLVEKGIKPEGKTQKEQIDKILDDIPAQINEENHLLSDYVQKLLSVMEYDIPYTSNALMKKLDLKSKETFRKNYLHPAIKLDLIRMTIPDKPRSRSQKYIKL